MTIDTNPMSTSDELAWLDHISPGNFWSKHASQMKPLGYQPPPEPTPVAAPMATEFDVDFANMSMAHYEQYRRDHGIDSSDFIGVSRWHRPQPTTTPNEMNEEWT